LLICRGSLMGWLPILMSIRNQVQWIHSILGWGNCVKMSGIRIRNKFLLVKLRI